ncbi:MAG: hypothetical protein F6K24_43045 [Okeania sp. SIO2D1]|nr:hypothetical protein [Okeania sp. SIO2D1]
MNTYTLEEVRQEAEGRRQKAGGRSGATPRRCQTQGNAHSCEERKS